VDLSHEQYQGGRWPTNAMIEAASRYKEVFNATMTRATHGHVSTPAGIIEIHQATLGLMWATHTTTFQEALSVLNGVETTHGRHTD
jgi:hypothetical protein